MWCWSSNSSGSSYDLIAKDGGLTDFRKVAYALHDYVENYRAAYRGETVAVNTPTMFFNKGNGTVEWIKPTQTHTYRLERSINGGAWTVLTTNGATVDAVGRKYTYTDTTLPAEGTVQYRVTVIADGATASAYSNRVNILQSPINLVQNHGFENEMTGWTLFGNNGTYRVTNTTARTGSYSLELDYATAEWQGVYQPTIAVKPNTTYTLSYYYKHAADATTKSAYCFIRGGNGTINSTDIIGQAYLNGGSTDGWTQETVFFRTTGDVLCIDFRVVAGSHVFIDDVELYEMS